MTQKTELRWYCVSKDGAATLCANQADANQNAKLADEMWPRLGPHRAVQLVDSAEVERLQAELDALRADVLRMAQEAGLSVTPPRSGEYGGGRVGGDVVSLLRFAAKAAAHEPVACDKVCDAEAARALFNYHNDTHGNQDFWSGAEQVVSGCADAIRARGAA